ncbi:Hsp20/alpha crystallin family protein [Lutimaribacter sp. EGI FJ00015]|uniref:Hsp20/alpha crystallin family protein n=1 Tax=Lutimaribacter degradans TaxID=2945989 RepID=A0ACC5ZY45_9RHOB|nr:Hsp20/alpha crystallin family protein [Lutimaribacter sp. EGI FJ00013]MCM2562686.1 Hsp20/alpha crystallin family protein [Lutimaribacter sp. EGI FJ00013]MCO0613843.1 Hsp20/alpha crystallin family protein [Lutimaribacter sp. EGI FJ00015]MCO0636674.1 Hsp20/alpha crystallin family protein [Lutimaribacter sp. EGI FJ00014]
MVEKNQSGGLWPAIYDPLRQMGHKLAEWLSPASDASTDGNIYRITMELPGVGEDDIDLSVHDGMVTVKGEKTDSREEKGDTWYFSERQYGSFSRSFRLPADADEAKVAAQLKDGVLLIEVGRKAPAAGKATKVKINRA